MGVRGVVLAGLIAAVMATLSGLVNSTSTMFSTDIYKKLIHKEATDREMVRIGRIASFAALLIAACVSPIVGELGGVFKFFQNALTYIACPFMATVLMGILWKRVNYAAGMFGLVGGFFIEVILGDRLQRLHCPDDYQDPPAAFSQLDLPIRTFLSALLLHRRHRRGDHHHRHDHRHLGHQPARLQQDCTATSGRRNSSKPMTRAFAGRGTSK